MATGYRIDFIPSKEDGQIVMGEPIGVFQDDEGEVFIVTATPVEVAADPSKATEHIGSVPSPDQLSS